MDLWKYIQMGYFAMGPLVKLLFSFATTRKYVTLVNFTSRRLAAEDIGYWVKKTGCRRLVVVAGIRRDWILDPGAKEWMEFYQIISVFVYFKLRFLKALIGHQ